MKLLPYIIPLTDSIMEEHLLKEKKLFSYTNDTHVNLENSNVGR